MTKEEMLDEAQWLVETNEDAKLGFDNGMEGAQHFTTGIAACFTELHYALTTKEWENAAGFWYGRIMNPNRPQDKV